MLKLSLSLLVTGVVWVAPVVAQSPVEISSVRGLWPVLQQAGTNRCTGQAGLACVLPNLYGPYGLFLPNPTHAAHFNSTFQSNFTALNTAIATQLTLLPLASPASGFVYKYDSATGVYTRSAQSFGPVLTERAETIGRHRFYFGANFQRFRFDKIDGVPLHNLPAVFTHEKNTFMAMPGMPGIAEPYETQFIWTMNSIDLKVNQFTIFGTYGLTDHIDVSVAVPLLQIGFNATSNATIERTFDTEPALVNGTTFVPCCSTGPPYAHYFDPTQQATSIMRTFSNNQFSGDIYTNAAKTGNLYWDPSRSNAAGPGDVTFRFKASVYRSDRLSVAALTDLRLPTGDERNFLGSGAWGVKPFAAVSVRTRWLTPHINVGYQWNGESLLAGNILNGTKATLPGYVLLAGGTDLGVWSRLTVAVDYIGQELINAPRVRSEIYTPSLPVVTPGAPSVFPTIATGIKDTYNQSNVAAGFKLNVFDRLLLTGNALIAANDGGLRERVTPLVGLSYTF
jgi:hypothetical protein